MMKNAKRTGLKIHVTRLFSLVLAVTCLALSGCGGKGDTQSSASTDQGNLVSSSEPSTQSKTESGNSKAASTISSAKPAGTQTATTPENTSGTVAVTSSQKGETVKKPTKSKISKTSSKNVQSKQINSDELSRTYVSMPTKTEAQKFAVIEARVLSWFRGKNFPNPQKIVEFSNTPRALWSLTIYNKSDLESLRKFFQYNEMAEDRGTPVKQIGNIIILKPKYKEKYIPWINSLLKYKTVYNYETVGDFSYYGLNPSGLVDTSQSCDVAIIDYGDKDNYYVLFSNSCGLPEEEAKHPELYGH